MARIVLVLSGEVGAGKTTLAERLVARYGAHRISTHDLLSQRLGPTATEERGSLQRAGERLDKSTGGRWVRDEAQGAIEALPEDAIVVIDSVRIKRQLDALRVSYGRNVVHLHLRAPTEELARRYTTRARHGKLKEFGSYDEVRANNTEAQVATLDADADVVIDTAQCTRDDVEVRAACHIGLVARDTGPLVDVIVGGGYGSEGKGNIAFYLAAEYDLLVRVGGPNAGHQVPRQTGETYTHRLLPSGTWNSDAPLLLGPGTVIDLDVLLQEIADCQVEYDRLSIDPQCTVITPADIREEKRLVAKIGSTGKGVGAATARRIRQRHAPPKLAVDYEPLKPFIRDTQNVLEDCFANGKRVLLEGTQGTMLSLLHGRYPHVTSRDTTVPACMAEAGIPPRRVRRVVMVCRTYPIRVQNPQGSTSGPIGRELSWAELSRRSGIPVRELRKSEKSSVTKKLRRVAEFDWALLHKAALLNGPTDIALTFADYLSVENRDARRLDQLTTETIQFVDEVERVAAAPVSLIATRFHPRSVIDRRHW